MDNLIKAAEDDDLIIKDSLQEGSNRHPNRHGPLIAPLNCEMHEPCHIAEAMHTVSRENLM